MHIKALQDLIANQTGVFHQIMPLNKCDNLKNRDFQMKQQLCKLKFTIIPKKCGSERYCCNEEETE